MPTSLAGQHIKNINDNYIQFKDVYKSSSQSIVLMEKPFWNVTTVKSGFQPFNSNVEVPFFCFREFHPSPDAFGANKGICILSDFHLYNQDIIWQDWGIGFFNISGKMENISGISLLHL